MTIGELHAQLDKLLACGANPEIEVLFDGRDQTCADIRSIAKAEPRSEQRMMCFVLVPEP